MPALSPDAVARFSWWTLAFAPIVAQVAGRLAASRVTVAPGKAGRTIPSLLAKDSDGGTPAARFDRIVRGIEMRLIERLIHHPHDAEAESLARELGVHVAHLEAALADLRRRVPCRLRVTRRGRLLHTFDVSALAKLRSARQVGSSGRAGLWLLTLLSNLGAVWPLAASIAIGGVTLEEMWVAVDNEERIVAGLGGLLAMGLAFGASWVAGWIASVLLMPGLDAPRFEDPQRGPPSGVLKRRKKDGGGSWDFSIGDIGSIDGEGCIVVVVVLVVALVLSSIAGCLFGLFVWARGLWRAVSGRRQPELDWTPARWAAESARFDPVERFVPTTDLVLRLARALRRALGRPRPFDEHLAARLFDLAATRGGRLSALEITLATGLDRDEALAVGARLAALACGEVEVSERGDIDFTLPNERTRTPPDTAPRFEILVPRGNATPPQLARARVALPGLTLGHLRAAERLAGGAVLLAALTTAAVSDAQGRLAVIAADTAEVLLPLLALGTFALVGVARHVAAAHARAGALRDTRRYAYERLAQALAEPGVKRLDAVRVAREVHFALARAIPGLAIDAVQKETEAAYDDLDLELDPKGMVADPASRPYAIERLRDRLETLRDTRWRQPRAPGGAGDDDDPVVFDTAAAGA